MPSTSISRARCIKMPDSRDSSFEIPISSQTYEYSGYKAAVPESPKDDLRDTSGLKARISYTKQVRNYGRNISPRFAEFIQHLKSQCEKALKLPSKGKERAKSIRSIAIQDGVLQSYWEKLHGPDGTMTAIVDSAHAFRELRLDLEYGDYLAVNCERYKRADTAETEWKTHSEMQWPDVDNEMAKEEREVDRYIEGGGKQGGMKYPKTPWLVSLRTAAQVANMDPDDIRFEIHCYAKRNRLVYSNVTAMIDSAQFGDLAGQILADKRRLGEMYGDTRRVLDYRLAIERLEKEWFDKPSFIGNDGIIHYKLNARALARMDSFFNTG